MNQAIVLVSFGVLDTKQREKCIEPIAAEIRDAFYDYMVFEAYTSSMILKTLKEDGAYVYSLPEVLDRLIEEKYDRVIVLPTHLMAGKEYNEKVIGVVEAYKEKFKELELTRPVFVGDGAAATPEIVSAVTSISYGMERQDGEALVMMGHGTNPTNHIYEAIQAAADEAGINMHIGVLTEGDKPTLDDVIARLEKAGTKKVVLAPLLLVGGSHVNKEMAGKGENTWEKRLQAAGCEVRVWPDGLGANMEFRGIYMQRLMEILEKLEYGC
ncbi:MAG: sirohydrochlorin cobaltochelatase [Selenomonadaceae bacterium]|nr:sirohydrochlorin cobaltochelatase [Selenomonadaceae bacterium]